MAKSCIRILVILFNLLFLIIGLGMLGFSIWFYITNKARIEALDPKIPVSLMLYALMGLGGLTALIALCGCCGAMMMNQCLLTVFFLLILVIFLAEVGIAVLSFIYKPKLPEYLNEVVTKGVDNYYSETNTTAKALMDVFQLGFECCGKKGNIASNGAKGYMVQAGFISGVAAFPSSCCMTLADVVAEAEKKPESEYKQLVGGTRPDVLVTCITKAMKREDCETRVSKLANKYGLYIIIGILVVAVIELFGMIFAMILCCHIRRCVDEGYVGVST